MRAYLIASVEVTDPETYAKYAAQTVEIAERFGGTFLVKGGACTHLEGNSSDRNVVVAFESRAKAEAFYKSDAYQKILPIALSASRRNMMIVDGV